MANWAKFGHFHLGVYLRLWPVVYTLMAVCYFEGTAHVHCYTSCTLTTLHCSRVSFLQCCHMKRYNTIFQKCEGCTHFCEILYVVNLIELGWSGSWLITL